jgi:PAS domain S-box-containing protein
MQNNNEKSRLEALYKYGILDTSAEEEFDEITRLAAYICQTPISLISFVDYDRQWFKSTYGISISETPRAIAFCDHTIHQSGIFIVENALLDERFANNPLVTGSPFIRFYAGAPLITPEREVLGAINVIDFVPRTLFAEQKQALSTLSHQVMTHLRLKIILAETEHFNLNLEKEVSERTIRLLEREKDYQRLNDLSPVGIFRTDPEGRCIYANQKACELAGITLPQALMDGWKRAIHEEDRDKVINAYNESLNNDIGLTMEYRFQHSDGKIIWVFNQTSIENDINGHLKGYIGTLTDITKLKESEEIQKYSEVRFRTVVEQSPIGIQIFSMDGKTIQVNKAWERIWNATIDYLANYNIFEDEQLKATNIMPYIHKAFAGEATEIPPIYYDPRIATPDQKFERDPRKWVRGYIYPIKDETGKVREVVVMHEDITEYVLTEQALKESEEYFRSVAETASDVIISIDENSKILYVNRAVEKMFGYFVEELIGVNLTILMPNANKADHKRGINRYINEKTKTFKWERIEIIGQHKSGREFPLEVSFNEFKKDQKLIFMGIMRDISERKKAEIALKEREKMLHRLSNQLASAQEDERRRISQYLHESTAQDLSTVILRLHMIRNNLLHSKTQATNSELEELINILQNTNDHLREFSYSLHPSVLTNLGLIEALKSLIKEIKTVLNKNIFEEIQADIPRLKVDIENAIYRITQEAIENSISHANAQKIIIRMRVSDKHLLIEVEDDGYGFDVEDAQSSGIGIIAMRERALSIGATLDIQSTVGKGTLVIFEMPLENISNNN